MSYQDTMHPMTDLGRQERLDAAGTDPGHLSAVHHGGSLRERPLQPGHPARRRQREEPPGEAAERIPRVQQG